MKTRGHGGTGSTVSFAQHAGDLRASGISDGSQPRRSNPAAKTVVGTSATNKHITATKTYRNVNVFVSRLHPSTAEQSWLIA